VLRVQGDIDRHVHEGAYKQSRDHGRERDMKRFRVFGFHFDTSASHLDLEIKEEWDEAVKAQHRAVREQNEAFLAERYGQDRWPEKRQNLIDIGGVLPMSIIAFHNRFLAQVRTAFVMEAYYPALTGACALGERILNHLLLALRDDFSSTPEYKRVYRKDSFDRWHVPIEVLEKWGVLLPSDATAFRTLEKLRNRAIHFDPATDRNDRELALEAVKLLDVVVVEQFGVLGRQPWFMGGVPGEVYISREAQDQPFVRRVYLPNCFLAGPRHWMEFQDGQWVAHDPESYPETDVTDDEWREMRLEFLQRKPEGPDP